MPFQPVPNAAEAVINGHCLAKPIANVLVFQRAVPYAQADLDALAAMVDGWVGSSYLGIISSDCNYDETHVRGLSSAIDLESINFTSAGSGGAPGTPAPANSSMCITFRTGFTGRSARGRFYAWPTSMANYVNAQTFNAAYETALLAFLNNIKTDALALGWDFSVLSRYTAGALRPAGLTHPITVIEARNLQADSQRRRLSVAH